MKTGPSGGNVGFLAIPQDVLAKFGGTSRFIIVGHEKPDADCLCSQLALHSLVQRLGKSSVLCSRGPFERVETAPFRHLFLPDIPKDSSIDGALVVVVDCTRLERTGFAEELADFQVMVIDHHASGETKGDFLYLDTFSPSTTLLVQRLIEQTAGKVTREEAEHIFLGFATDTGYFRFLETHHGDIFPYIGRLLDAGVAPRELQRLLSGGQPFTTRTLLGRLLLRVRSFHRDRLRITYELEGDVGEDDQVRDSPQLYHLLLSCSDTEIVVHLRQVGGEWTISFRSHNVDVGGLAKSFGGGGHRLAAGCRLSGGNLEQVIARMVEAAGTLLEKT